MTFGQKILDAIDWKDHSTIRTALFCESSYGIELRDFDLAEFSCYGSEAPRIFWSSKTHHTQSACWGAVITIEQEHSFDKKSQECLEAAGRWFFITPFPSAEPGIHGPFNYLAVLPQLEIRKDSGKCRLYYRSSKPHRDQDAKDCLKLHLDSVQTLPSSPSLRAHASPHFDEWSRRIAKALESIREGNFSKIVLGCKNKIEGNLDLTTIFAKFVSCSDPGFRYWFDLGDRQLIGKSPERLFLKLKDTLSIDIIAGTKVGQIKSLADFSEKDVTEHRWVSRGVSEVLASIGADFIESERKLLRQDQLQHIASVITANLTDEKNICELMDLLHPTPAICGWPKRESLRLIEALESDRGWCAGLCGYCDQEHADVAVAIRSIQIAGEHAEVFAGCGIVSSSNAASEWIEAQAKLKNIYEVCG